jgi:hypothetical protein
MMQQPKRLTRTLQGSNDPLLRQMITNALDLMYFWYYQPRGRHVFRGILERAGPDERNMLIRAQHVLLRKRTISKQFLDGLVGKRFDPALAFYLGRVNAYLAVIAKYES